VTTVEPTIPKRLRRLHRLYLAAAQADAAIAAGLTTHHMSSLRTRAWATAQDEAAAIEAAALAAGLAYGTPVLGLRDAISERLRLAVVRKVRLALADAALKDAIAAPVALPKSQFVEERKWLQQDRRAAEAEIELAIRDALSIMQITDEAA
jgi:hypothetical protein